MIITNSKKLAENLRMGRNHGINRTLKDRYSSKYPWEYDIKQHGYNYRLDEIRSTLGINQLKRINKINSSRRNSFKYSSSSLIRFFSSIFTCLRQAHEFNAPEYFIIKRKIGYIILSSISIFFVPDGYENLDLLLL